MTNPLQYLADVLERALWPTNPGEHGYVYVDGQGWRVS
jgi:hypothetical protein